MNPTNQIPAESLQLLQQLRWRSRRGLLELELLLLPFASDRLEQLDADQLHGYERLLGCEDLDIYDWLQQRDTAPDAELREIVAVIREHQASRRL